jgi:hypothetical protein
MKKTKQVKSNRKPFPEEFERAAKILKVAPITLAAVLADTLGRGVRMSIMSTTSPLCGIEIKPPLEIFLLLRGPTSKRETPMTEERVAKMHGFNLDKTEHGRRWAIGWNHDTDRSAEWQKRAA